MRPPADGEITYYAQLGVEPTASTEQIRETYRSLVRLLHPDQQTAATGVPARPFFDAGIELLPSAQIEVADTEIRAI